MQLRNLAINGILWNSFGTSSTLFFEFLVGIVLARLLTPGEFGVVGTVMVVIAVLQVFVNSGFSQAIIRKKECNQRDYSTAFFFNLASGIFLFLLLLLTAGKISHFFENPELKPYIQVLAFGLVIGSLSIIQQANLSRRIDFKLQAKISLIASAVSGVISISMAFLEMGVWSLVAKSLIHQMVISLLLWFKNRWRPDLVFDKESFKELFNFGYKLLLSGLIATLYSNIYRAVIAKYFSVIELGYFTRAELFKNLPIQNASKIISAVGYPVLAKIQDDPVKLLSAFRLMSTTTFFFVVLTMSGLAAVADSLVLTLIGEQWKQSVIYLQMLCIVGIFYPLNSLNVNLLSVVGRSDLYLKLQLISHLLVIPALVLGVIYGVKIMIIGMLFESILSFIYFSKVASKFSRYRLFSQIKDIAPHFLMAFIMGVAIFIFDRVTNISPPFTLSLQLVLGTSMVIITSEFMKIKEYLIIKRIVMDTFHKSIKKYHS